MTQSMARPAISRALTAALLLVVALLGACSRAGELPAATHGSMSQATLAAGVVVTDGPGWSSSGLQGSLPASRQCTVGRSADGRALPDPRCTPGAIDARVTQADLSGTICRPGGYTSSVRPPESLTEPFKEADLGVYGETGPLSAYELDHLVPLELGGSSNTANLWPEPDDHPPGAANSKDPVEGELHDLVCAALSGRPYLPLAEAQALIATDWTTAMAKARSSLVAAP